MLPLLRAGILASCQQLVVVLVLTLALFLTEPNDGDLSLSSARLSFFTWSYVLVAAGLALTSTRSVNLTADRMYRASVNRQSTSKSALMIVAAQFSLAAILCAILALRHPPQAVAAIAELCGTGPAAPIVWAAFMSIAVAGF